MSWSGPAFTPVFIPPLPERIRYADKMLMIGSCFAEHIAGKMHRFKYQILANPFGVLYNPVSLAESIYRIATKKYYTASELVFHDELYHSMDHHGVFSGPDADRVIYQINQTIEQAHQHVKASKFIFISPGTSWVYRYKPSSQIVGNCHKVPQTQFEKIKLSVDDVIQSFENIRELIQEVSPAAQFIWTVSPVRHLRDGLIENQRSKATLIVAIEQLLSRHEKSMFYFPAYELMVDQLRDYRYYARDLFHPNEIAIDIIWDLFLAHYLDPGDYALHEVLEKITQSMHHRFLHDRPEAIAAFAQQQLKHIDRVASMSPELNLSMEREYFLSLIQAEA